MRTRRRWIASRRSPPEVLSGLDHHGRRLRRSGWLRSYNLDLSKRRAGSVQGVPPSHRRSPTSRAVGYGKTRLVVPNAEKDAAGRRKNRRVVFVIESKGDSTATTASTMQ